MLPITSIFKKNMGLDYNKRSQVSAEGRKNDNCSMLVAAFPGKVREPKCIGLDKVLGKEKPWVWNSGSSD